MNSMPMLEVDTTYFCDKCGAEYALFFRCGEKRSIPHEIVLRQRLRHNGRLCPVCKDGVMNTVPENSV